MSETTLHGNVLTSDEAGELKAIQKRYNSSGCITNGETGNVIEWCFRLAARVAKLERELAQMRQSERDVSDAYVRLRAIIPNALRTPYGPTAEQVQTHTEECATALVKDYYKMLAAMKEAAK